MSFQVIVKHGDHTWDAIGPNTRSAMFRVGEHMERGHDMQVAQASVEIRNLLLFGDSAESAKELLEGQGFEVTIKELSQGANHEHS